MSIDLVRHPILSLRDFIDSTDENSRFFNISSWIPCVGSVIAVWKTHLILNRASFFGEPPKLTDLRCKKLTNPHTTFKRLVTMGCLIAMVPSPALAISLVSFELICDVYNGYKVVKHISLRK